jgi:probable rRNA maturation factor
MIIFEVNNEAKFNLPDHVLQVISEVITQDQSLDGQKIIDVGIIHAPKMREVNKAYADRDEVTDVLSFTELDAIVSDFHLPDEDGTYIGELLICKEVLEQQAVSYNVPESEEFVRLMIHGVLHILGYDHEMPEDAQIMRPLEEKLMECVKAKIVLT